MCSVRPPARAYLVDYQLTAQAPLRAQQLAVRTHLARRLSADTGLRVNGYPSTVWILPPPILRDRAIGRPASMYVRVGTRMEIAPRQERTWVRQLEAAAGRIDAPPDNEGTTIEFPAPDNLQ